ncbi:uncharacterized protein [Antedon mediterranea]|uniref:uncharacterized protein isoform X2 n=1 Tax=Antedon mediterranea TaxID=105859 RepID=UPI003AF9C1B6
MEFKGLTVLLTTLCYLSMCFAYPSQQRRSAAKNLVADVDTTTDVAEELATQNGNDLIDSVTQTSSSGEEVRAGVTDDYSECETPSDVKLRLARQASVNTHSITINATYSHTGNTCPNTVLDKFNTGTDYVDRSTCPYEYLHYHNSSLYPDTHKYVRCKCEYAIDVDSNNNATFSTNHICQHDYYNVPVLRITGCVNGFRVYEYDEIKLPVTCYTTVSNTNSS